MRSYTNIVAMKMDKYEMLQKETENEGKRNI